MVRRALVVAVCASLVGAGGLAISAALAVGRPVGSSAEGSHTTVLASGMAPGTVIAATGVTGETSVSGLPTVVGGDDFVIACPSARQCVAVGGGAFELTFNPTAPRRRHLKTIARLWALANIACPSLTQCTALGAPLQGLSGMPGEATFNPVSPRSPVAATSDRYSDESTIACPSVRLCVALSTTLYNVQETTFNPASHGKPTRTTIANVGYFGYYN
ncbi:MAG: hypothetical protein ABSG64_13965 [Solirubrobacteraceae bacterium]